MIQKDKSASLRTNNYQTIFQPVYTVEQSEPAIAYAVESHPMDSRVDIDESGQVQTLTSRMGTGGCNGKGWKEDVSYTLNTIDRPAVAFDDYCIGNGQGNQLGQSKLVGALNCMHDQQAVMRMENAKYIVRRLTPTECCRLQGFPDGWGEIDHKDSFSKEECNFWNEVRKTFAEFTGKPVKEYTEEQLLKWYNGLHTDSAEYKMWGNGIALPTALYVMEGIAEALNEDCDREKIW